MASEQTQPRISVITPSYNQGEFLEETITSVLDQGYPNLEYMVIDGGSTDNSVEIIQRYAQCLTYWVSEPDNGPAHAINKGFARSTGAIMAWLNSDDKYLPWTLQTVAEVFRQCPKVNWLTSGRPMHFSKDGQPMDVASVPGFSREAFFRGYNHHVCRPFRCNMPYFHYWIPQEETFWRRSLWERSGGAMNQSMRLAFDYELWARFWKYEDLATVDLPLGGQRLHSRQLSRDAASSLREVSWILSRDRKARFSPGPFGFALRVARRKLGGLSKRLLPVVGFPAKKVVFDPVNGWRLERVHIA